MNVCIWLSSINIPCVAITDVPGLLEAVGGVDVGEGRLEAGRIIIAGEPVVVEVVAGGDHEVGAQLLPNHSHLQYTHIENLNSMTAAAATSFYFIFF